MTDSVPVVRVLDPRLDIQKRVYYAKQGGANITHQQYSAVSATNSQVVWSQTTPSVNVGVDRRMYIEFRYHVSYPASVLDDDLPEVNQILRGNALGLRAYPVASAIETVSLKLNNSTMTSNCQDLVHALQRYGTNPDERNRYLSGSPSYPDQFPTYNDDAIGGIISGARNPFAGYSTNVEEISRQPFNWADNVETVQTGPGPIFDIRVRSFDVVCREPLFSPGIVNWSERPVQALFGVQTIDVTLSLVSDLKSAVFAGIASNTAGSNMFTMADVSLVTETSSKPRLHLLYITPQMARVNGENAIPNLLQYPYYELNRYTSNGEEPVGSTELIDAKRPESVQSTINNITLHSIPKRMYIYARPIRANNPSTNSDLTIPNVFAEIRRLDINFNNRAGILSSAESYDLYAQSVHNGCDQAWSEWQKYQGSVLCIDSALDLPLNALEAPGSRGNYQFQYKLDYANLLREKTKYQIYTIAVGEGFMTINDAVISLDIGVLTEEAIQNAGEAKLSYNDLVATFRGGGFVDDIFKGVKKAAKVVGPVADIVADVAGTIPDPRAQGVALGARSAAKLAKALGGRKTGGSSNWAGAGLSGGADMSASMLKRRL